MKALDIYAKTFNLAINKSDKMKTKVGLICSILTAMAFILAFITLGMDLFYKRHPKLTIKKQVDNNNELVIMNSTTIPNRTVIIQADRFFDRIGSFIV